MDRASIFFKSESDPYTFDNDEALPPLPLPELQDTLERYYESLLPFGTAAELANSRAIIEKFKNGVGPQLQLLLKQRAAKMKNWLGEWWEKYAYLTLRLPLYPYIVMGMPLKLEYINIVENPSMFLKNLSRITYHTLEYWDLMRKGHLKPLTSNGGKVLYSSALNRSFFSTSRVPGVDIDHIDCHFKTLAEGPSPTHGIIAGKGRIFMFNNVHEDGTITTPLELLCIFQRIRSILDYEPEGDCVPVLTHDERTSWANNRHKLLELSPANKDMLHLIESATVSVVLDEHEPKDYSEVCQLCMSGDFHSKWADRSSTIVAFKNGRVGLVGEHTAYDGTISVHFALFIMLSLYETPEPDWKLAESTTIVGIREIKFDLNEKIRGEIKRVVIACDQMRTELTAIHTVFDGYGKEFMKTCKLHPDSFVQVILQLAYTELHNDIAPIYETALMRQYYNGRTETLRSCTPAVAKFLQLATSPQSSKTEIIAAFRAAVEQHARMMNEARQGRGIDRHLFGLWCIAHEQNMDIPEFYEDPLYSRSGGNGNYVLSTSTLGYTHNLGFVGPMVLDGYGVFYSITSEAVFMITTGFRGSEKTSPLKFNESFAASFRKIQALLNDGQSSKL